MKFARITMDPNHMSGEPCIRGLPISVATVVELVGDHMPATEIIARHPELTAPDILEAMEYHLHTLDVMNEALELGLALLDDDEDTIAKRRPAGAT